MASQWALWLMANQPERLLGSVFIGAALDLAPGYEDREHPFEEHSARQIEDSVGWGLATSPAVLIAEDRAPQPDETTLRGWCARSRCPVLVIHGDDDQMSPPRRGEALAEATGGTLVVLQGAGHIPLARDPVKVNLLLREFVESLGGMAR